MIRIAVVEDDENYRNELGSFLQKLESENNYKFKISYFTDGDEIAGGYKAVYDIILMDIEMQFMDGMSAAEYIRKFDSNVIIIFITNTPQYAMKGYQVDALDYCLKPLSYFAFSQRMIKAIAKLDNKKEKTIAISLRNGIRKIELSKLLYIEVLNHDLIYHTIDEKIESRGTMREMEEALAKEHFFRCSKCYLVNLEHVNKVDDLSVTVGSDILQISRLKKKQFMDELNKFMNE